MIECPEGGKGGRMRKEMLFGVVALAALTGRTPAQSQASTILGGANPQNLQQQQVDTSRTVAPVPGRAATLGNRFNFSAIFNKLIVPSAQKVRGVSPLPSPNSFPKYQDFKLVGTPPFPLAPRNTSPIQPMAPFVPK